MALGAVSCSPWAFGDKPQTPNGLRVTPLDSSRLDTVTGVFHRLFEDISHYYIFWASNKRLLNLIICLPKGIYEHHLGEGQVRQSSVWVTQLEECFNTVVPEANAGCSSSGLWPYILVAVHSLHPRTRNIESCWSFHELPSLVLIERIHDPQQVSQVVQG